MTYVCFDCGGSSIKYGLWNGSTLEKTGSIPTPITLGLLLNLFEDVIVKYKNNQVLIEGIAFSMPGSVDIKTGIIGGLSAIEYIHNFDIVTELQDRLGYPVSIENDANCAALAEMFDGSAFGVKDALFLVIGTGIGGAVITDGKLQKGTSLYGGEFGYMLLDGDRSFSTLGTAVNMATRYNNRQDGLVSQVSGKEVFEKARLGDRIAREEVETFYHFLAKGIYNLQFTTDPECIILGGAISRYEPLIPELTKRLDVMLSKVGMQSFKINLKTCKYLGEANLIGAAKAFDLKFKKEAK